MRRMFFGRGRLYWEAVVAGKRKGRTGLEWLLEKGLPEKAEENGSGGAAPAVAPDDAPASDVDGALAMLDLPPAAPASTVLSKAPAASSLALDSDTTAPRSGEPNKRTLDPVANALAMSEPAPPPKNEIATEMEAPSAAEKTTKSRAASSADAETTTKSRAAKSDDVDPSLAKTAKSPAARSPEEKDGVQAKRAVPVEPEALADDEDGDAGDEPSLPPAAPAKGPEPDAVLAHRKALSSGRSTRAFPRANVPFEVRFKKASDSATGNGRNVSIGGFFVETKKLLPEGEVFQAQLFFPKRERKMSVIAEVMWATSGDPEDPERFPPGMGCKFLDVDERDTPFVQGVIDEALAAGSGTA